MPRAIWNGTLLADSDDTVVVEGNHYFPRDAINAEHFEASEKTTWCPWKGTASYFTVKSGDAENRDAAWYYPEPKAKAAHIRDRVAFWRGVEVQA
jgi:uncharacterized protein (DUF427 family)